LCGTPGQQCFHVHLDFDGTNALRFKVLNFLFPCHERLFIRGVKGGFVFRNFPQTLSLFGTVLTDPHDQRLPISMLLDGLPHFPLLQAFEHDPSPEVMSWAMMPTTMVRLSAPCPSAWL
jgi:hypothetical protein